MFIETLEFTIPIDLCTLFTTLQKGPRSNLEFPASVNSYGTTQDACLQVGVRANKLTFKVDGVSSDSSMISKSECKTLKLAVFDVDRSLIPQENDDVSYESFNQPMQSKRTHEDSYSSPVPAKSSRTMYSDSPSNQSPVHNMTQIKHRPSDNSRPKPSNDTPVNVKQEPEDPDLIEIEPDPEPDDIVPKKETPYMQIDYSSNVPHTQTSQAALERVSFPPTSRSQSSSSSYHQNVPHVQDYSQPGSSHGDQSADDFLVFQDDNDYGDDNDNSADYSNDDIRGGGGSGMNLSHQSPSPFMLNPHGPLVSLNRSPSSSANTPKQSYNCPQCYKVFARKLGLQYHIKAIHENMTIQCVCGKTYSYETNMTRHQRTCRVFLMASNGDPGFQDKT